ncbi:ester cyclase [Pararhodobacter oceanensis]|uniref:Polyketide cyclase n=1 Tax=Pararhodobacter oceanensis TaxID=2172121 RepID=A0A2T8HRF3_9RHOB|nr:ester cyclase [Pararhodobacter oceanensis]PVH28029.1 polyketide cyclase [Pararhodobacter oceanensis]
MTFKTLTTALAFATLTGAGLTTAAYGDDTASVQSFYDLLSNPGAAEQVAAFEAATAEDWTSSGDYSGADKTRAAFLGRVGGFAQLIPDLNWEVQAMHQDGAFVTVRSRATGTPIAPLFGVDGEGRSFDIMTIDIHQLEDGVISRSWHVEDWAGALQQLSGH